MDEWGEDMMSRIQFALLLALLPVFELRAADIGLAENKNFIVSAPTAEIARTVARKANLYRSEIARKWLGKPLPDGYQVTHINVAISKTEDRGRTWPISGRRDTHKILLTTSKQRAAGATLKHEVAHVVMATYMGKSNRLPVWLDEGIASGYDDRGRKRIRERYLRTNIGRLSIGGLFEQQAIRADQVAHYAMSESLTGFLVKRGRSSKRLLKFAADGQRRGWTWALWRHYKIRNVDELNRLWRASVRAQ